MNVCCIGRGVELTSVRRLRLERTGDDAITHVADERYEYRSECPPPHSEHDECDSEGEHCQVGECPEVGIFESLLDFLPQRFILHGHLLRRDVLVVR